MKKNGFTLAEVLITLGIVGVIAAMTIPTLMANYQKQVWGTSLAAAVSDFENGIGNMIISDGASNVFGTKAWLSLQKEDLSELYGYSDTDVVEAFTNHISPYLGIIEQIKDADTFYKGTNLKSISGTEYKDRGDGEYTEPVVFLSKKGYAYQIYIGDSVIGNKGDKAKIEAAGGQLFNIAANVAIDVNGIKKPNTYGRDLFFFVMGPEGTLYPVGGYDYSVFLHYDNSDTWQKKCANDNFENGIYCTGRIVENKYKMDY